MSARDHCHSNVVLAPLTVVCGLAVPTPLCEGQAGGGVGLMESMQHWNECATLVPPGTDFHSLPKTTQLRPCAAFPAPLLTTASILAAESCVCVCVVDLVVARGL
jgi:hypothetical protein